MYGVWEEMRKATGPSTGAVSAGRRLRLAYVVSHPIQYQAGLLRRIAADPAFDLTVIFCSDFSLRQFRDSGFGVDLQWDVPLTEGYRSIVLRRLRETSTPSALRPLSYGFLRALRRGIDGQPFDAVWVHGYATLNALHAMIAARLLGLPVLLRAESWLEDRQRSRRRSWAKRAFFCFLRPLVSAVLPIGSRNAAYWRHYFGPSFPSFPVPYAVDNDFFATETRRARDARTDLQVELRLQPGRPVILFASKLQRRKHCDHLLQAFLSPGLPDGAARPYLVIVGDGEMREALEKSVGEAGCTDVRFAGFRNQRELPRFFDLATVFVLPSRHEPWGLITNEAMAAGLPVIVSEEVGCAPDLVREGVNGFTFPAGDVEALRLALGRTLEADAAERMGEAGRRIVSRWSYEEDLDGLRSALLHVTHRAHAPLQQVEVS